MFREDAEILGACDIRSSLEVGKGIQRGRMGAICLFGVRQVEFSCLGKVIV